MISHLFGSQAAFQAETMARALDAGDWIEQPELPPRPTIPTPARGWRRCSPAESARGPRHGARPKVDYAALWALWLSTVPYGLWSERVSTPSMEEHVQWVEKLEGAFAEAIEHFGLRLREAVTLTDLAGAAASLIEGAWLNQCLTATPSSRPGEPSEAFLRRSGPPAVGGGDYGGVVTGGSRSSSSPSMSRCSCRTSRSKSRWTVRTCESSSDSSSSPNSVSM